MAVKRIKQTKSRARRERGSQPHTKKYVGPRTLEEFSAMPERKRDIYTRVTQAVTKMKEHVSLRRAARELGLDPRTVKRIGGAALRRNKSGRFVAKASDRLLRVMVALIHGGKQEIAIRDSRQASLIAQHWNAAHRYLSTGDASALRKFRGKHVTDANGTKHPLLTDLAELDRLGNAGEFSFETIYARAS